MSKYGMLRSAGLTNSEAPSYGELAMGERIKYRAFCSSHSCNYAAKKSKFKNLDRIVVKPTDRTEKQVRKNTEYCPDCGKYLYWASDKTKAK